MIRTRTRRGILALAALAAVSWLFSRGPQEPRDLPLKAVDTRLNYALFDFSGQLLNDRGEINVEIEAPLLRNNARSGVGTILNPEIRVRQDGDDWLINAESAIITPDREHVSLMGAVTMVRQDPRSGDRLEIRTEDVMLNVTPRTASTESEVRIRQGSDRLQATGMRLDLVSDRYRLLNDVRGMYETS